MNHGITAVCAPPSNDHARCCGFGSDGTPCGCACHRGTTGPADAPTADAQSDDDEIVNAVTAAMREADRVFEKVGGSTRHHVRDCLLPVLNRNGWRIVKAKPVCPCGLSSEPWHVNGICARCGQRHYCGIVGRTA
jgi:hypothetical protein